MDLLVVGHSEVVVVAAEKLHNLLVMDLLVEELRSLQIAGVAEVVVEREEALHAVDAVLVDPLAGLDLLVGLAPHPGQGFLGCSRNA